jgi:hypothetical protein
MKEAVVWLRAGRVSAATASVAGKRKKSTVAALAADDMLSELNDL